ncbi:MAG TPA: glycosyltransferase family 39 protein [Aggregatilinea sp.]|uniref:glycosyltransferase family 39 protein n=1 Tax=Aggregatilinea sp. TaxID=2806333 RepID=UPI002C22F33B|nr:glycosyltransferase family 39 protein [Aggregatilinea sp.]HML24920.1 glycosyltransferase family 39 protein [Aggregatilinea sp.]
MNRRIELILVTLLLLLAAVFRSWDLSRVPSGFSDEELAYVRLTEAVQTGNIAVYYQVGDDHGRSGLYAVANAIVTRAVGDGLLGYRMLSFWASLLSLALLYALARRLFGRYVALMALGAMSVNTHAVLLARTATSESLVPFYVLLLLFTLAVAFHVGRTVHFRAPSTITFALVAMLFGASGYLHYTTLVLGPLGALFFVHLLVTHQPMSRRIWSIVFFVLMLATIVALPYLTSTLRELSASEPDIYITARPRGITDLVNGVLSAIGGLVWKGDTRITYNLPGLALLGPALSLLLVIGTVRAVHRWREPRYALMLLSLLAGLATDVWIGSESTFSANLVALPALYILPAVGVMVVWRALSLRSRANAVRWVTALAAAILVVNVALTWNRVFAQWGEHADADAAYHADLGRVAAYLDRSPDDSPAVICMIPLDMPNAIGLSPRQILPLMMHREDVSLRSVDCRSGLVFVNAGAPMRLVFADPDYRTLMPPELAEWLEDATDLRVNDLPDGSVLALNVEQRIRDLGGYWNSVAPAFYLPETNGGGSLPAQLPVTLERNVTFAGYDPRGLTPHTAGGEPIVLASYWRVDGPLPTNLGVFVHLLAYLNPRLQPLAESNTISVVPSELRNRDIFIQVSYLWLSDRVRAGDYPLTIGAFTGEVAAIDNHLRVIDRHGELHGERLLVGSVPVLAPAESEGDVQ